MCTTNHRGHKDRMTELEEALQHIMQELNNCLERWEMKAIWQKTRVMSIGSEMLTM